MRLLLLGGVLADGTRADVAVDPGTGTISAVAPVVTAQPGDAVEDCAGMVLLPAAAEPHAHLDKALSALAAPNPLGDLAGAIVAWQGYYTRLTHADLVERATRAVEEMVAAGTTAIRTHVDVGEILGLTAIRALEDVKLTCAGLADIQIVAMAARPLTGAAGAANRKMLSCALDAGADVVGGSPWHDDDPPEAIRIAFHAADRFGAAVDLHTDETLDPAVLTLRELARQSGERGPGRGVTASHCVSLGMQPAALQEEIAAILAAVGVAVVTLPQTNLYLQARGVTEAPPRGLTALAPLLAAGVTVGAGADNVRDPFCSMGRLDATETAALLAMAGHLSPAAAWAACSRGARACMGLPVADLNVGDQAEILAIEGADLTDAIAGARPRRVTIHRGHIVARTVTSRTFSRIPEPLEVH